MWVVTWNNIVNNRTGNAKFETEIEAAAWLNDKIEKGSIGKGVRYVIKGAEPYDERLVNSEEIITDSVSGETYTQVKLNPEYTYTVQEIDEAGSSFDSRQLRLTKALEIAAAFKPHIEFGQLVQLYFIGLVNQRGYNSAQKDAVIDTPAIKEIIRQLGFGRISKSKSLIDQLSADESTIFAADLMAVKALINDFLVDYPA